MYRMNRILRIMLISESKEIHFFDYPYTAVNFVKGKAPHNHFKSTVSTCVIINSYTKTPENRCFFIKLFHFNRNIPTAAFYSNMTASISK